MKLPNKNLNSSLRCNKFAIKLGQDARSARQFKIKSGSATKSTEGAKRGKRSEVGTVVDYYQLEVRGQRLEVRGGKVLRFKF